MNEINVLEKMLDGAKNPGAAIVLTHNVDFIFAQNILVNRLRRIGAPRLTVFADAGCATAAFNRQGELADRVGHAYRVVPVDLGAGRRFHPKAILLVGPDGASLAVGSGNLGHGGWSGNREIWTYFDFPGAGGPQIAAFREYLEEVCDNAGVAAAVRSAVLEPFTAEKWAADLPEPGGLLALPADTPLMDRMLAAIDGQPTSFDLHAPYFDPEGYAATQFAERLGVPMRILMQHNKAGLSEAAGAALPENATILGVAPAGAVPQKIHAKLYAARFPDHALVFAGSANCSRMALLRARDGNAELMAASRLSLEQYDALLKGLEISDGPPELPETAPNDDWDSIESPPVRVLSASYEDGLLSLRCKFAGEVPDQVSILFAGQVVVAPLNDHGAYTAEVSDPGNRVWVEIQVGGQSMRSASMWIDHEAELRIGRPEHDVNSKLATNHGPMSSDGLIDLFAKVLTHLKHPVAWSGQMRQRQAAPPVPYNIAEVFSDGFGRRAYVPVPGGGSFTRDDWAMMFGYFSLGRGRRPSPPEPPDPPDGDGKMKPDKPAKPLKPAVSDEPLDAKQAKKLIKLAGQSATAMSTITFLESRPPERLGADIRMTALLLAKARRLKSMAEAEIDMASASLFRTLFVGGKQGPALLDAYLAKHPAAADEMQSSELAAVMTLWISDLLKSPEAGAAFEFAASRLAARYPWITQGQEDLDECMRELSIYAGSVAEALPEIWTSWVRSGAAVAELIEKMSAGQMLGTVGRQQLFEGEVVWVSSQFAIVETAFDRSRNGSVFRLADASYAKYKGSMVLPVCDVLDRLGLAPAVLTTLKRLLSPPAVHVAAEKTTAALAS